MCDDAVVVVVVVVAVVVIAVAIFDADVIANLVQVAFDVLVDFLTSSTLSHRSRRPLRSASTSIVIWDKNCKPFLP